MVWKESTNTSSVGTSTKFGAADINKYSQLLKGNADVDTVDINSPWTQRSSKYFLRNPADTFSYTFIASALLANRNLTFPLLTGNDTLAVLAEAQTFSNKTLDSSCVVNSASLGADVVTLTGSQTLTNKTLTAPIISTISNTGTITIPNSTDVLVGRDTTDTLTNKTLTTPTINNPTLSGSSDVLTLPAGPDTLIGRATTDTLTNKTLTLPVISAVSNSGTVTFPTGTLTLASLTGTENLTNKTLDSTNTISSATSLPIVTIAKGGTGQATATLGFDALSPMTTAGDVIIGGASGTRTRLGIGTANQLLRVNAGATAPEYASTLSGLTLTAPGISTISNTGTLTLPTSTDTLVGRDTTDILTNKTLTLPVISSVSNSGTITFPTGTLTLSTLTGSETLTNKTLTLPVISSISNGGTVTIPSGTDTLVARTSTDTLTNKTLTSPAINTPTITGSGGTLTLPAGPDTLVGRATTDTLTNKTLTAPVISTISNTGTITLPTSTDTLVGKATTDTLTNKSIDAFTNTFQKVRVSPSLKKHGAIYGTSTNAADGCLSAMVAQTAVLTGTTGLPVVDASGTRATWSSGTTINSLSGWRITGAGVWFCRALNPVTAWKIDLANAADTRFFAGYVSSTAAPASSADPGNAISTVGFWLDTGVDGNWHIMQNNGTGASDITTIANVAAADTSAHTFALRAVEASTKFQYAYGFTNLATATWVDINTDIPASTTGLTLRMNNECLVGSAAKIWHMWWLEHEQDA